MNSRHRTQTSRPALAARSSSPPTSDLPPSSEPLSDPLTDNDPLAALDKDKEIQKLRRIILQQRDQNVDLQKKVDDAGRKKRKRR